MVYHNRFFGFLVAAVLSLVVCLPLFASPTIDGQLAAGQLEKANQLLVDHLADEPQDDLARFQLGTVQLLQAVEQLAQDFSRYGTSTRFISIPFLRIGQIGGEHPNPQTVTYEEIREVIGRFQKSVATAEQTLAKVDATDLYWELRFEEVKLDLNGDGKHGASEQLDSLFRAVANRGRPRFSSLPTEEKPIVVGFDSADVYWLRGYCHVLMAMADMVLAYDHQRAFDLTAHAYFAKPDTKFAREHDQDAFHSTRRSQALWGGWEGFADLIATVHLINFKLREPERMADAREHLLEVIALSRKSWGLILVETDNRHEWIPGPDQKSVIPRLRAAAPQIEGWQEFLDEAEAILNAERLVPFWRSGFEKGLNLKRVFTDPRDFDLILWIQGTAALPYLETGEQTDLEFWRRLQRLFGGQFFGFALWVN